MSIYDNIAFGVRLERKISPGEMDCEVEDALRRAALWDEVKDNLSASGFNLSGGQQQRLCIARSIAIRPEVFLLDEPCSAIDPISSAKIEETIAELKKDHTIIIVHTQSPAGGPSSGFRRLYVSWPLGRVRTPASQIFVRPKDRRTQQFITAGRFG